MGEGTLLKSAASLKANAVSRPISLRFDVPLLLIVFSLGVFGLLMVYSASNSMVVFSRQLLWMGLGIVAAIILTLFDYHKYRRWLSLMWFFVLGSLLAVLVINDLRWNAARTILDGSIQPSELAKVVIIIYLAFWLSLRQKKLNDIYIGLIPMGVILGITCGLIYQQPDLSATITIFLLGFMLFFLAGGSLRQIVLVAIVAIIVGWLMVVLNPGGTASTRITSYFDGMRDPLKGSMQLQRSLEGIIKGGWFGVGIGKADIKWNGLPVPARDSIFVVIVEETGLFFSALLVILYGLLIWRGLVIAKRAKDQLGSLLAAGMTFWIAFEAILNMGMVVGLVPIAGNALPFMSAGGSSLVVTMAGIGIIMSVARQSETSKDTEGRTFSAVVNLRRWDRGRRVSRSRHPTGPRD
jgi:cell division protein FtsW